MSHIFTPITAQEWYLYGPDLAHVIILRFRLISSHKRYQVLQFGYI